jgi:hypothetical protein
MENCIVPLDLSSEIHDAPSSIVTCNQLITALFIDLSLLGQRINDPKIKLQAEF